MNEGASSARAWVESLRSGSWLSADRLRRVAAILAVFYAASGVYLLSGEGHLDPLGHAVGSDFAAFYGAARALSHGIAAAELYSPEVLNREIAAFTGGAQYVWVYPPPALLPYRPLAGLPYLGALAAWLIAGLGAYLLAARRIVRGRTATIAAALCPAVYLSVIHGHNGLLVAALVGGGLVLLPRAPYAAGLLLGFTAMKPHLAILVPLALIAGRQRRALAGMLTSAAALVALATAAFGTEVWTAFHRSTAIARAMLEDEGVPYTKIASVFAAARLLHAPVTLAYVLQGVASMGAVWGVVHVWRQSIAHELKCAIVIAAGLLATPYLYDYDLPVLAMGVGFWTDVAAQDGWRPWERSLAFAAWGAPLLLRPVATAFGLGVLPIVLGGCLALLLRRAAAATETPPRTPRRSPP